MILVIDVGTTSIRVATMNSDGEIVDFHQEQQPPATPFPGLVEFDPLALSRAVIDLATAAIRTAGGIAGVAITTQRASTVVWNRSTGEPVGPGLGWQDLRTVGECMTAKSEHGVAVAPNQSATKAQWLLDSVENARGLDLCIGTIDSWIVWALSSGEFHITDHTNAAVTGWYSPQTASWDERLCDVFNTPMSMLPTIVDSVGECAIAHALPGSPPIVAVIGDQQASLVGQGCVSPGLAKITFGTGGMLDTVISDGSPLAQSTRRGDGGCFGIVAWAEAGQRTFGAESIMLAAGSNIDWLRDDLGLIATSTESHNIASTCASTEGVMFVPAPLGLGTPHWDYGARSTFVGLTRGTTRAHMVRAVLEGVAHRGADLVEAVIADAKVDVDVIRIDGGMSKNPTFVQALADFTGLSIEVSPHTEGTTIGAGRLALVGTGEVACVVDTARMWNPSQVAIPTDSFDRSTGRATWKKATTRSLGWIPELSSLDF